MHGLRSVSKAGVTAARTAAAGARRGRTLATKTRGIAKGQGAASRGQAGAASIPARNLSTVMDSKKSWVEQRSDLKDTARKAIVYEMLQNANAVAEALVPWFTDNMPASYFRQVTPQMQKEILRNLIAIYDHETDSFGSDTQEGDTKQLVLQSSVGDTRMMTFINYSGDQQGLLRSQLEQIPAGVGELARLKVFTSVDERLCVNMYSFEKPGAQGSITKGEGALSLAAGQHILSFAEDLKASNGDAGLPWSPLFEPASLTAHIENSPADYVKNSSPRSFLQQMILFNDVSGTELDGVHCEFPHPDLPGMYYAGLDEFETGDIMGRIVEGEEFGRHWCLKVALTNAVPQTALYKILTAFNSRGLNVMRLHLDKVDDGANGHVTQVRLLFQEPETKADMADYLSSLERDIKRLKWVNDSTINLSMRKERGENTDCSEVGLQRAEIIMCLKSMLHPILSKKDPWAFSRTNIASVVENERYMRHATGIADLFASRFDPAAPLGDARYEAWKETLRQEIDDDVEEFLAANVLHKMIDVVDMTFRTNLFLKNRYALALRLDPAVFNPNDTAAADADPTDWDSPFGVFFVHGRRFNGFHVRFRDIARGGMRLVTPPTEEQLSIESARHFDECYGLAFAQQLKNKDIPEGGSKCVVLIDSISNNQVMTGSERELVLRKSVKAFTDAMLDLIVDRDDTTPYIVDKLGRQELVYLGPDEQVIPDDINWIVKRAEERGYPIPSAFMSSKPDSGFNHKTYGVTSEGVQVFLDTALKNRGMHPLIHRGSPDDEAVTLKITGGTDGDVAGNMILILDREYGDRVKIVGMADGTAGAEDPDGLDMAELVRLVKSDLPLAEFDQSKLSAEGVIHDVSTLAGLRARNTMHNRVVADAFIPAGGRPNTVNIDNWDSFLLPDGTPSSPLVVEGANLFITHEARQKLFEEAGVEIVKDSSANKCGVICSSYEIMSSMLLSDDEFHSVKDELVGDVLDKLRELARMEAELLFREFNNQPGALPQFSERISNAINRITDAITQHLDTPEGEARMPELMHLVKGHLPKKLESEAWDRFESQVPPQYVKNAVASTLASRIVYREGIRFVEDRGEDARPEAGHKLARLAFDYLEAEGTVSNMLAMLESSNWGDDAAKETALKMITHGGVRSFLEGGFANNKVGSKPDEDIAA